MIRCPVTQESDAFLRECELDEAMTEWVEDRARELAEEMLDDPVWRDKVIRDFLIDFAWDQAERDWEERQAEERSLMKHGYPDDY